MLSTEQELIAALKAQTEQLSQLARAINAMAKSNQEVIAVVIEVIAREGDEEGGESLKYLDGRPCL